MSCRKRAESRGTRCMILRSFVRTGHVSRRLLVGNSRPGGNGALHPLRDHNIIVPILHAGGFGWDEAVVLFVAILAVPALSWITGRFSSRERTTMRGTSMVPDEHPREATHTTCDGREP
jgi:hypothetical protein